MEHNLDEDADINDGGRIAIKAVVRAVAEHTYFGIQGFIERCDSPARKLLATALITVLASRNAPTRLQWHNPGREDTTISHVLRVEDEYPSIRDLVYLTTKAAVGTRYVDFLIEQALHVPRYRYVREVEKELRQVGETLVSIKIIIECSDYNDLEPITDHVLGSMGYKVFRFSPSEVFRNAIEWSEKVNNYVHEQYYEIDGALGVEDVNLPPIMGDGWHRSGP